MSVFTVFCHGTGEHRDKNKSNEIIHDLSELAGGLEYVDYLILDGPGAGKKRAGTFDPFDRNKSSKPTFGYSATSTAIQDGRNWSSSGAKSWSLLSRILPTKVSGLALGSGMDDNIRHAIAAITEVWDGDFTGKTINLVGWSRGAVTCLRLANWLQEFYGGAGPVVNIFALDPVAGMELGVDVQDTYIIPPIVKEYVAVIVEDERRGGFLPQDLNRLKVESPDTTKLVILPVPGSHDTLVRATKSDEYAEVPLVTRYLAYHFLSDNGTRLAPDPIIENMSTSLILEYYAKIKTKREGYSKLAKGGLGKWVQGGLTQRGVKSEREKYMTHSAEFFVNQHHVECFKHLHPALFDELFSIRTRPRSNAVTILPPANRPRRNAVFGAPPPLPPKPMMSTVDPSLAAPPQTRSRSNAIIIKGFGNNSNPMAYHIVRLQQQSPTSVDYLQHLGAIDMSANDPLVTSVLNNMMSGFSSDHVKSLELGRDILRRVIAHG